MNKYIIIFSLLISSSQLSLGQSRLDTETIQSTVNTFYKVISGPKGKRDWDRLRNLCEKNAQFNVVMKDENGNGIYRHGTLESYIKTVGPVFYRSPFFIREIGYSEDRYSDIAQVFSAYESSLSKSGPAIERGLYSFQLSKSKGRWYIVNVIWTSESSKHPLPERFLN